MCERTRESTDDLESARLPETHGSLVGRHDEVELHGSETGLDRTLQRVLAHRPADTASTGRRRNDVAAVRNVGTTALVVGFEEVRADNLSVVDRHVNRMPRLEPVGECFLTAE